MNEDENFMTSARYLIYIGLVLLALFIVDEQHKMEVFVFAGAVGFYLESRKEGWQSPLIEWPDELSFLATCYYASLKFIKFGIILEAVVLIYLFHNGLIQIHNFSHIVAIVYIVSLIWLTATASVLSICWSIHDQWAKRTGSTTIASLNPPFTQGTKSFKTWSWLLFDGIIIVGLGVMWWDNLVMHLFDVFELTAIATVYFLLMVPMQLWMYFHYKGLLPQKPASIEQ
ncbi:MULTISPECIES: hypothetical protein [Selenomonas]|uniref:hypothetical protein n=1 Tax=Selenomonas TaxID=970 RepID=UPI0016558E48|nr:MULTISPECIES: hypothetical protein [unclassified Selenomonas]MBQ1867219.1 hypothetical protein [Selenomonas sp.]